MPFIPFKLKKANTPSRFAHFDEQPSWADLASKISQLFNIPSDRIGVAFITKDKEPDILANERDLHLFYKFLDQSSQEIKFVVQDLQTPDRESAFSLFFFLNTHQPLVYFPPPISLIHHHFIQPQTQSLQLGQRIPICLIYPRVVSNQ